MVRPAGEPGPLTHEVRGSIISLGVLGRSWIDMWWAIAVVGAIACSGSHAPSRGATESAALPNATRSAGEKLDAQPSAEPAPGHSAAPAQSSAPSVYTRIDGFGVDLELPENATVRWYFASAFASWNGCAIELLPSEMPLPGMKLTTPHVVRRVGTMRLVCVARPWAANGADTPRPPDPGCLAVCDHMHAAPGASVEQPYPIGSPALILARMGGNNSTFAGAAVWDDGTVQFFGTRCSRWRGARAAISPERARELLAKVDAQGFFAQRAPAELLCGDDLDWRITARHRGDLKAVDFGECGAPDLARAASDLGTALGTNPCAQY